MHTIEQTRDEDLLRHAASHEPVSHCPLLDGNDIRLLPSGADTLAEMFALLARPRTTSTSNITSWRICTTAGKRCWSCCWKSSRGASGWRSSTTASAASGRPKSFFDTLSKAGAQVLEFHPVNPLRKHFVWHLNDRDHRKIMLVDGRTAFIGGVNMSRVYKIRPRPGPAESRERVLARLRRPDPGPRCGASAKPFSGYLAEPWRGRLPTATCSPRSGIEGEQVARIAGSLPHEKQQLYFSGIHAAV